MYVLCTINLYRKVVTIIAVDGSEWKQRARRIGRYRNRDARARSPPSPQCQEDERRNERLFFRFEAIPSSKAEPENSWCDVLVFNGILNSKQLKNEMIKVDYNILCVVAPRPRHRTRAHRSAMRCVLNWLLNHSMAVPSTLIDLSRLIFRPKNE